MTARLATVLLLAAGCVPAPTLPPSEAAPAPREAATLREVYADAFLVGTALNARQIRGEDERARPIVEAQFDAVTAENAMKWASLHPEPGRYDFALADSLVAYAEQRGMAVIGHTLVWHSQTPAWVFEHPDGTPRSREELLALMEDHIATVAGRYRGRIHGWDVVNEALEGDGSLRDSPWRRIIGDDYLEHAFRFARAADPDAALYYNDYALVEPAKRAGAVRIARQLAAAGVPLDGIGLQGHFTLGWPTPAKLDSTLADLAPFGEVMVTELEITVLPAADGPVSAEVSRREEARAALDPYPDALPDSVQAQLAARYRALFEVLHRRRALVSRVTFWGVTDGDSWRNGWPIPGRTDYPLLFDREGRPKPAYDAVLAAGLEGR